MLDSAWRDAQRGALRLPKRQLSAPTLHTLLAQADELNDLLQAKLYDVCVAHGGTHHACGVKAEKRALQKVFRSYGGDWRRLGDLCRTSLVFECIPQLEACLRAIGADGELELLVAGDEKMRLREGFDAAALTHSLDPAAPLRRGLTGSPRQRSRAGSSHVATEEPRGA